VITLSLSFDPFLFSFYGVAPLQVRVIRETVGAVWCTVLGFRRLIALEDAIGSHACSLEANIRAIQQHASQQPTSYLYYHKSCRNTAGMFDTDGGGGLDMEEFTKRDGFADTIIASL
jgi:hypothetical protein